MKKSVILFITIVLLYGCHPKQKKENGKEDFFPVLSYIKSQVAHVDTSLYPIIKVSWKDTTHTDTIYVKREQFRDLAKDFLQIPDLTDKKYKELYTEEKFFDEGLNTVVITCTPNDPEASIIQRQEVLISKTDEGDKVKSFIIDISETNKDSSVDKKLLWQVDRSFQVFSTVQKPEQPEITSRFKVIWNENDDE